MPTRSQRHLREIRGKDSAGDVAHKNEPSVTVIPIITGTAKVGQTLTRLDAVVPGATKGGTQWYADGNQIAGATGNTYVPVTGDIGKVITVRQYWENAAGGDANPESQPTAAVIA